MAATRWNDEERVWEFWQEAWGGWCVLREGTHESTRPMSYEQGMAHVAERYALAEMRHDSSLATTVVRYEDTRAEPRRPAPRGTEGRDDARAEGGR